MIFCYVNHQLVFPVSNNLARPTDKRLHKIFLRSHVVEFIIYCLLGLFAYFLLLEHVNIIPIEPMVLTSITSSVISLGKLFMVFALFFAVPLNLFPARQTIYDSLDLKDTRKNHLITSLSLAFSGCLVAILF